jgi:hypothetical protein
MAALKPVQELPGGTVALGADLRWLHHLASFSQAVDVLRVPGAVLVRSQDSETRTCHRQHDCHAMRRTPDSAGAMPLLVHREFRLDSLLQALTVSQALVLE